MIKSFKKTTPEEKLLHIIERPEKMNRLLFRTPTLHGMNKILIWISAIVTLIFVFYFIGEQRERDARFGRLKKEGLRKEPIQLTKTKQEIPGLSTYISNTEKNNPFHVLPPAEIKKKAEEQPAMNLQLVGIIWSARPQAIIEDKTTQKNFLVYEGDMIDKIKIEKITQDEVRLNSEDGAKILR